LLSTECTNDCENKLVAKVRLRPVMTPKASFFITSKAL
jgi:hypothetical protein